MPFGETNKRKITIVVADEVAHLACAQHTAWMLTNLLCRSDGIVEEVCIVCPTGVALAGRIVPLSGERDLLAALRNGGQEVGVVPIGDAGASDYTITVGTRPAAEPGIAAFGNGWIGGIITSPFEIEAFGAASALPYGPYVAACLAAGEVFKSARLRDYSAPKNSFYSLWDYSVSETPCPGGPDRVEASIDALLGGVGAVGCALLHALWCTEGLTGILAMADNDAAGLESTNLNRYVLFGKKSVGGKKASMAAALLKGAGIDFDPHDSSVDSIGRIPPRVISAVDTNSARHAIQLKYPARIFSASTSNLRAELLRCGPPGIGACLACHNPEKKVMSDDEVRQKLLREGEHVLEEFAAEHGVEPAELRQSLERPACGSIGERAISILRPSDEPAAFAVGFVSAMAGTMLAAEFVKDHLTMPTVLSDEKQRAVFQFINPLAGSNRASFFSRQISCRRCDPNGAGFRVWKRRHDALARA